MAELDTRLLTAEPRYKAQHLFPMKATEITQVLGDEIYDSYQDMQEMKYGDGEQNGQG